MKFKNYSYTLEQLIDSVKISFSYRQTMLNLGLNASGNAYDWIRKNIKDNNIDISHFTGQGWLKNKTHTFTKAFELQDIFNGKYPHYSINKLRKRLIKDGLKKHECEVCHNTEWRHQPIPIELDHINGNNKDHRLENLRIICPNCHAQTDTYAGKNKNKTK